MYVYIYIYIYICICMCVCVCVYVCRQTSSLTRIKGSLPFCLLLLFQFF